MRQFLRINSWSLHCQRWSNSEAVIVSTRKPHEEQASQKSREEGLEGQTQENTTRAALNTERGQTTCRRRAPTYMKGLTVLTHVAPRDAVVVPLETTVPEVLAAEHNKHCHTPTSTPSGGTHMYHVKEWTTRSSVDSCPLRHVIIKCSYSQIKL